MKKFFTLLLFMNAMVTNAQNVGVGTSNPLNKLHVAGGLRLDTLTGVNGSGIVTHNANGVIYGLKFSGNINDVLRGDGTFGSAGSGGSPSNVWMLIGNSGTNPATNFLGTTDEQPLWFRIRNQSSGIIDSLSRNTSFGYRSGAAFTSARENTSMGYKALLSNTQGAKNTAMGSGSLSANTSGNENVAIGYNTLNENSFGQQNIAIGSGALMRNAYGVANVAVGHNSLLKNTANYNTATGYQSLTNNTSGETNSAFGANSLFANTEGSNNTAIGYGALQSNQYGLKNTAVGSQALFANTADENSAFGFRAMWANSGSSNNDAFGAYALENNTGGSYNSSFGKWSLRANVNGLGNAAFGAFALRNNNSGAFNTAIGIQSLFNNLTGSYNTAVGMNAGISLPNNVSNVTVIGYNTGWNTTSSNQVNIGNFSVEWIGGQKPWSTYSDKRMKQDIKEDVPGLAFITRLKPVTYHINLSKEKEIARANNDEKDWEGKNDIEKTKMTGFLAQDVEQAANEIGYKFSGVHKPKNGDGLYSLEYGAFVVPLVKAVQEQQQIIEKQQKQIDDLLKRIEALEKK